MEVDSRRRVFVSYSRIDRFFAAYLVAALEDKGYAPFLDTKDIVPGEPWRERLEGLILSADAVVFVMSPDSLAGWTGEDNTQSVCAWEIRRTLELGKQLVALDFRHDQSRRVPVELGRINFVDARAIGDDYAKAAATALELRRAVARGAPNLPQVESACQASGLAFLTGLKGSPKAAALLTQLDKALKLDEIQWTRAHTKWVGRAVEWDRSEPRRSEGKLLRTADIGEVEAWAMRRPAEAPAIPRVLEEYVAESRAQERRDFDRLRFTLGRAYVQPAEDANARGENELGLRLAAAGAVAIEDAALATNDETRLWGPIARSVFGMKTLAVRPQREGSHDRWLIARDGTLVCWTARGDRVEVTDLERGRRALLPKQSLHADAHAFCFSPDGAFAYATGPGEALAIFECRTGRCLTEFAKADAISFVAANRLLIQRWDDRCVVLFDPARGEIARLTAGPHEVAKFEVSPDLGTLAKALEKVIILYATTSLKELGRLEGHTATIETLAFSPDGNRICSSAAATSAYADDTDPLFRVWDLASRKQLFAFEDAEHAPSRICFSPDGSQLLTIGSYVAVWDAHAGELRFRLREHTRGVSDACFNSSGTLIATASGDRTCRIWDSQTGRSVSTLAGHDWHVRSARFLDADRELAATCDLGTLRVFSTALTNELLRIRHNDWIASVSFSSDGKRLLTASRNQTTRIWEVPTGRRIAELPSDNGFTNEARFSPDCRYVIMPTRAGLGVFDGSSGRLVAELPASRASLSGCAFDAGFTRLAVLMEDGSVGVFETAKWQHVARIAAVSPVQETAIVSTGQWIATRSKDGRVEFWSAADGSRLGNLEQTEAATRLWFDKAGTRMAVDFEDTVIRVWDLASGAVVGSIGPHGGSTRDISFAGDRLRILTSEDDETGYLWDLVKGRCKGEIWDKEDVIRSSGFCRHGRWLAIGNMDQIRIRDALTGQVVASLAGGGLIHHFDFSPDGTLLASGGTDGCVRLWDVSRLKALEQPPGLVLAAALDHGLGHLTATEKRHLLLSGSPEDLRTAVVEQLAAGLPTGGLDLGALEKLATQMRAPMHPWCYRPPSQMEEILAF